MTLICKLTRVGELELGDSKSSNLLDTFANWSNSISGMFSGLLKPLTKNLLEEFLKLEKRESYSVSILKDKSLIKDKAECKLDFRSSIFERAFSISLVSAKEIRPKSTINERDILIKIQIPSDQDFVTGQNIAIYPRNSPKNVLKALSYFKLNKGEVVVLENIQSDTLLPFKSGLTVHEIFEQHIDLSAAISYFN